MLYADLQWFMRYRHEGESSAHFRISYFYSLFQTAVRELSVSVQRAVAVKISPSTSRFWAMLMSKKFKSTKTRLGHEMEQLIEALCHKPEGPVFESR
jgi:hypothetical protein